MIRQMLPDIATIDLCMPYIDGSALLETIQDLKSVCKIIVSDQTAQNLSLKNRLLVAGAATCISKSELALDPAVFFRKIFAAADSNNIHKMFLVIDKSVENKSLTTLATSSAAKVTRTFPIPVDENERIKAIDVKGLANAISERQFDLVTKYVAEATGFPVCLLTFIDHSTQWIKSSFGSDVDSTPRSQAFCNYTITQEEAFIVTNAKTDPRFSNNPLVLGEPNIKTYAGHPVITSDGVKIGALCLIDSRTRVVMKPQLDVLAAMAEMIAETINLRPISKVSATV